MVKVSVIVPVYNTEKYLNRCLDSLIDQELSDIEIIIVNDGSTDDSQNIIDKYIANYPQKIICINKKNGGQSEARNLGLNYAKGEYIGFVDSDDRVEKDMYKNLYKEGIQYDCDIVFCDVNICYPNKRGYILKTIKKSGIESVFKRKELLTELFWQPVDKIYKRSFLLKSNITFPIGLIYEDLCFMGMLILHAKRIGKVDRPLYNYYQRSGSSMQSKDRKTYQMVDVLKRVKDYFKNTGNYSLFYQEIEFLFLRNIILGGIYYTFFKSKTYNIVKEIGYLFNILHKEHPLRYKNKYIKRQSLKKKLFINFIVFTYKIYLLKKTISKKFYKI